jgi:myo-inositol-1(or 4)-monophosphatase
MKEILEKLQPMIIELCDKELMPRFNQIGYSVKDDGSLLTEADTTMQQRVADFVQTEWPQFALLGEEMSADQQQRLLDENQQGLWILDPLDGTRNFASGVPIFSVSIALLVHDEVILGLIYDPVRKECFTAIKGQGAWLNNRPVKTDQAPVHVNQCIAQVDLKRLSTQLAVHLAKTHPYASQRNFGSGALDWCWVATGRVQLYVHGGQKLWDYAAGQLILSEAGGCAFTLDNEAIFIRGLQPRSVAAAMNSHLLNDWSAILSKGK